MLPTTTLDVFIFGLAATVAATSVDLAARDNCNPCNPQGASGTSGPSVGPDLKSLYLDLLASTKDIHFRKRQTDTISIRSDGFCCHESLDCVKVQSLNIPMCYDKFTTNYAFPDGSFGSLTSGDYHQGGSQANLFTGEYSKQDGESGNVYANDPGSKPNTATLSIPPQWTATGVGSAIPATEIASVVTNTKTSGDDTTAATTTTSGSPSSLETSATSSGSSAESASTPTNAEGSPTGDAPPASSGAASHDLALGVTYYVPLIPALMYAILGL